VAASLAVVLLIASGLLFQYKRTSRAEIARSVGAFTEVASALGSASTTEVFQEFDALRNLSLPAESELDLELLVALQK
jgi:hypothetical protein